MIIFREGKHFPEHGTVILKTSSLVTATDLNFLYLSLVAKYFFT